MSELMDQEKLDRMLGKWQTDPMGMRNRIIGDHATSPVKLFTAMIMATQEEAAAGAMLRGEHCVTLDVKQPCPACRDLMFTVAKGVGAAPTVNVVEMRPIWMGPERKWVCEMCMTPMRVDHEPKDLKIIHQA